MEEHVSCKRPDELHADKDSDGRPRCRDLGRWGLSGISCLRHNMLSSVSADVKLTLLHQVGFQNFPIPPGEPTRYPCHRTCVAWHSRKSRTVFRTPCCTWPTLATRTPSKLLPLTGQRLFACLSECFASRTAPPSAITGLGSTLVDVCHFRWQCLFRFRILANRLSGAKRYCPAQRRPSHDIT